VHINHSDGLWVTRAVASYLKSGRPLGYINNVFGPLLEQMDRYIIILTIVIASSMYIIVTCLLSICLKLIDVEWQEHNS